MDYEVDGDSVNRMTAEFDEIMEGESYQDCLAALAIAFRALMLEADTPEAHLGEEAARLVHWAGDAEETVQ